MYVTVFCSPTHLKVVIGTGDSRAIKVDDFGMFSLPEGAMINGIITDEETMIRFLSDIGKSMGVFRKETLLVIDTNSIRSKVMDLPVVSEQKILEFVTQELASFSGEETNDVFDYAVLNGRLPDGGARVLGVAVDRSVLQVYRNTLTSAGFNLKSVNIGVNALIKLVNIVPELSAGASILAVMDDRNMSLSLFERGEYKITHKYRIYSAEDTPDWRQEIGGNISSMIQFHKGQRPEEDISAVFFAGLSAARTGALTGPLSYLGIEVGMLDLSPRIKYTGKAAKSGIEFVPGQNLLNLGTLLKK